MTKKTITREQYYQVEGLWCLAQEKMKGLNDIQETLAKLLGIESESNFGDCDNYYGCLSDDFWSCLTTSARSMLKTQEIKVQSKTIKK